MEDIEEISEKSHSNTGEQLKEKKEEELQTSESSNENQKESEFKKNEEKKPGEEPDTPEKILDELGKEEKTTKNQNKQLRNILIGVGVFVALIIGAVIFLNSVRNVGYEIVDFEVVKEGELIFYTTKIPLYNSSGEHYANYNFYLRNNPKELKDVDFKGVLTFKENIVLNEEENFNCEGYGIIAVVNLKQLYEVLGAKVIKDEKATCDEEGRYMYINLKAGDKTKIEQYGPACYNIIINNCEILEGTERFMLETFVMVNEQLNS